MTERRIRTSIYVLPLITFGRLNREDTWHATSGLG
jgi:hypothetical protein